MPPPDKRLIISHLDVVYVCLYVDRKQKDYLAVYFSQHLFVLDNIFLLPRSVHHIARRRLRTWYQLVFALNLLPQSVDANGFLLSW